MDDAARICRAVYEETAQLYAQVAGEMGHQALGYRILYGPAVSDAEILFIGYQPGGSAEDAKRGLREGEQAGWPNRCDYSHADWALARRLQRIWDKPFLAACTGINVNFFRAPSMAAWRRLPPPVRRDLEHFSLQRCKRIVRALRPRQIVVIGLTTFNALAEGEPVLMGETRVLAKRGTLWDIPATGVVHLSGARINGIDAQRLAQLLNPEGKSNA
ncbi:hypothetical protein [Ancylobacter sp. SL191]|uniref:hypothetical protein n=1 Tax=Ancylobacter sp. SL191 TaxID=2995166 RepID=UPI00226EACB0|nr:hypothetical protein [Ancylobacter sp. SL191]WAC28438.1 hypothetical protein OU996_05105 [Ancylobacter sp. SL191]